MPWLPTKFTGGKTAGATGISQMGENESDRCRRVGLRSSDALSEPEGKIEEASVSQGGNMNPKKLVVFATSMLSFAIMCGCDAINPNKQIKTTERPIPLIASGPEVERLLSVQRVEDANQEIFWREKHSKEEMGERAERILTSPDSLYPGQKAFLAAMAKQPAEVIPASSYLRLLEDSKVKCSKPMYTTNFIKVRVTSGPLQGHIGWVCENDVFRTVAWP